MQELESVSFCDIVFVAYAAIMIMGYMVSFYGINSDYGCIFDDEQLFHCWMLGSLLDTLLTTTNPYHRTGSKRRKQPN
mgnify:CR=1 FL=1